MKLNRFDSAVNLMGNGKAGEKFLTGVNVGGMVMPDVHYSQITTTIIARVHRRCIGTMRP